MTRLHPPLALCAAVTLLAWIGGCEQVPDAEPPVVAQDAQVDPSQDAQVNPSQDAQVDTSQDGQVDTCLLGEGRALGQSCCPVWSASACADEAVCAGALDGEDGICVPAGSRLPGETCQNDEHCESQNCGASGRCLAPPPKAFPSAYGFGKDATGGRQGRVIFVDTLEDPTLGTALNQTFEEAGAGSLRWALTRSYPRIIVPIVSGYVDLTANFTVYDGDFTYLGMVAPGQGLVVRYSQIRTNGASNFILRHFKSRLSDHRQVDADALWIGNGEHIIVDSSTFSWGTDETFSFYDVEYGTIQNCFVAEGLNDADNGNPNPHGYGGLFGGDKVSFYRNLLAHFLIRNPSLTASMGTRHGVLDLRENVTYNWYFRATDNGPNTRANLIRNYYKPGPSTFSHPGADVVTRRFLNPTMQDGDPETYGKFYLEGNVMPTIDLSANQWAGVRLESTNNTNLYLGNCQNRDDDGNLAPHPIPDGLYDAPLSAEEAYARALTQVGAYPWHRDPVDTRILAEVESGTVGSTGSRTGIIGIIDSQEDVGGFPALQSVPPADIGTSRDGIPDPWKIAHGLDPQVNYGGAGTPEDAPALYVTDPESSFFGYRWIEVYSFAIGQ